MTPLTALTLLAALASSASTAAQTPPVGDTALAALQGRWTCAGKFERSGKPLSAAIRFDWEAASSALVVHHADLSGGAYRSVELWSPAAGKAGWRAVISDAYSGMRHYTAEGWRDGALAWTRDDAGAPAERFTYAMSAPDRLHVTWETGPPGGVMQVGDRLACTRDAPD